MNPDTPLLSLWSRHVRPLYASALDPANGPLLDRLAKQMKHYYTSSPYHAEWIAGINAGWDEQSHAVQIAMCRHLPTHVRILEVGCGDGKARSEIASRVSHVHYTGVDLRPELWAHCPGFVAGSADSLPFRESSFDVLLSMFVIEHLVFPHRFLAEAWRVLRPGGWLLVVAPDFTRHAMPSEWIGLSYGSGRDKLKRRAWWDALLTLWDSRIRVPWHRSRRRASLKNGRMLFPILLEPVCLYRDGFTPDCDAVYPASPEEIAGFVRTFAGFGQADVFYRDRVNFGLRIDKAGSDLGHASSGADHAGYNNARDNGAPGQNPSPLAS